MRRLAVVLALVMVVPTLAPATSAERGPPFVPDTPDPVGSSVNSTWENVTNTFTRTAGTTPVLFREGFEGPATLGARGWTEEVLDRTGTPVWSIAEQNDTLRAQGERTAIVPAGDRAATVWGAYGTNRDVRLVTPPIDLRFVTGASGSTDVVHDQPDLAGVIATAKDALKARLATSVARDLNPLVDSLDKAPSGTAIVDDREGLGLVNLTFFHLWDLAQGDNAWLDVRTLENGTWSSWSPLSGDLVFETEVDYGLVFYHSAYCDVSRGARTQNVRGPLSGLPTAKFCTSARLSRDAALAGTPADDQFGPLGIEDGRVGPNLNTFNDVPAQNPASLSGVLETLLEGGQYPPAYYNGQTNPEKIRAWNASSHDLDGALMIRKAHFTLNRFIGKEIQVGFHLRSGPATAGQYGWFVDEVEVRASVPDRDPGVNAITLPQPGDLVAEGSRIRPVAKIANNGRMPVRDVDVTFLLTDLEGGTTFLKETQRIPYMDGVSSRLVAPNTLSDPLTKDAYRLQVSLVMPRNERAPSTNGSGEPAAQIDANDGNNAASLTFAARTVHDVRVFLDVPAAAIMTDVDAPKEDIRVRVENRGNLNTTGVLNVTVHAWDEATKSLGPVLDTPVSETLPAVELPFGKDLNVQGSSENTATRAFSWTGRSPGIYVLRAVFHETDGPVAEAAPQNVFVRRTPTSNLGPLSIAASLDAPPFYDMHPGAAQQICIDPPANKNCFDSWGWSGASSNGAIDANACGVEEGTGNEIERPPMCPFPQMPKNLGTADGEWAWVATHDDRFVDTVGGKGTNILDEGILELKWPLPGTGLEFGPDVLPSKRDHLYVSFRHNGQFDWSTADDNFANPNGFRGQFRVVEDTSSAQTEQPDGAPATPASDPDATDGPGRVEGAPSAAQERLLYSVNFTKPSDWDRVVLDLTPVLAKMPQGTTKRVQFQWVAQTTPADVTPDWRTGPTGTGASGTNECNTGLAQAGACTVLDPVPKWALDALTVFTAPVSASPIPVETLWKNGAEPSEATTDDFTDCAAALDANGAQQADVSPGDALSPVETDSEVTRKCRHWQREKHYPVPTSWHLDATPLKGPPTLDGQDRSYWLRWGNPYGMILDPEETHQAGRTDPALYSVLQTPRFDLAGTQTPALAFDQWHAFQSKTVTIKDPPVTGVGRPYPTEGGNVWISGYDEDGVRVLHEILFPGSASDAKYLSELPYHATGATVPGFRGIEPEWSSNYTQLHGVESAFVLNSGGGAQPVWQRATFDLTRYAHPDLVDLTYAIEFHAFQFNGGSQSSKGWRIDNIQVRESNVANDVGVAEIVSPGSFVGPEVTQPVVIRVRNDGYFAQKGVQVNYTIYDAGGGVVFGPVVANLPYGGPGDELPGRLQADKPDKNATFPFPVSWTPTENGVYTIVAKTELKDSIERLPDENPLNDVLTKTVVVSELHDVSIHDVTKVPDALTVSPFIGPVGEARSFSFVVENAGTVPERFLGQSESLFRVDVDVLGEDGRSVLSSPFRQNLRELVPGQKVVVEFPDSWVPVNSGVYRVVARLVYPTEDDGTSKDDPTDNVRTVKVLVFDVQLPQPGSNLTSEFTPDDISLWGQNATRYATADGWSFPPEFDYPASADSSLVLDRVLNLHSVRSSFLRINQSFDFERGYDGGRVEMSLDGGRTWTPVEPLQKGGWEQMSTASPFVTDPNTPAYAFTGQGQGTWEINLGALDGLHATATLVEDDFEDKGLPQLRADLTLDAPRPVVPTPGGVVARFEASPTTDVHEVALVVTARRGDADAAVTDVWAQASGTHSNAIWHRMTRDAGSDRYSLKYPQTVAEMSLAPYAAAKLPLTPVGSVLRFRAFVEGERMPSESGMFRHIETGLEALPASREIDYRLAPGQPVLWSDKSAVLCPKTLWEHDFVPVGSTPVYPPTNLDVVTGIATTREDCRSLNLKPTTAQHNDVNQTIFKGPVRSIKYLETTVDVAGQSAGQGSLRIDIRDAAALPPVFHDNGISRTPVDQTVRVTARIAGQPDLVRDPMKQNALNPDRYWNWTDRTVVFQGDDWAKMVNQPADALGHKYVTVRIEHVVAADTSGDTPDVPDLDFMSLVNTDEYGPHFGWAVASLDVQLADARQSVSKARLDAAALTRDDTGKITLPSGWRQGVDTTYLPKDKGTYVFHYTSVGDVFELTTEPFAKDFWHQASALEWVRPSETVQSRSDARLNRFWEANASRLPDEAAGGAARLVMPLDLKPAVGTTTLTFNTQYNFRQASLAASGRMGASGGRVEISTDDGETWIPLTPLDALRAPVAPTWHEGQVTLPQPNNGGCNFPTPATPNPSTPCTVPGGEKWIPRGVTYSKMFEDALGGKIANHFAIDNALSVGQRSEFGSGADTFAFTGKVGGLSDSTYKTGAVLGQKIRDWSPAAFDLTDYAGRDVLIGFHATFSGTSIGSVDPGSNNGWSTNRDFWRIDDLKVVGEVFQGDDVRLRLHASSDSTVAGGGWDIRDLQVLSQKHVLNLGARILSPTTSDDLHVGDNPFVVEVANKGIEDVEDVVVNIWVNATGDDAPPDRAWSGRLSTFVGCDGDYVPADGGLPSESTVRICGTLEDGTLEFSAAPGATYEFRILAVHRDFASELLVGDNIDTRVVTGDQVIVRDSVQVERVTLLPSILDRAETRPVEVTATLALVGFDRADVTGATLDLLGDPDVPVHLDLSAASSFDPKFTEPGQERSLTWTLPRETLDALRDGVYRVEVKVHTAGVPTPSVLEALLYKGAFVRASPDFLFDENVERASMISAFAAPGYAANQAVDTSGRQSSVAMSRSTMCTDDPKENAHRWCTYHTPANETTSDYQPSPYQSGDVNAGSLSQWQFGPVKQIPNNVADEDIPPSVKEHGTVFTLPGFKNICSTQLDSQQQPSVCVPHFRAVSLESPPIGVAAMGGDTVDLRRIGVQFAERHEFGDQGIFAKVYVAPWKLGDQDPTARNGGPWLYSPDRGTGWIELGTFTGRSSGNSDLQFVTFAADAGAAIAKNWTEAKTYRTDLPEVYDWVKVRIVLYMPPDTTLGEFQVDDILVGPFVTTLGPAQTIPLNDDTDKTYTFFLKNAGAFSDVVNVTLRKGDGSRSLVPSGWNVTLIDEDGGILDSVGPAPAVTDKCAPVNGERKPFVELVSGEVRRIRVKVCIPVTSGQPGRAGFAPIDLTAFSQKLPGLLAGSTLSLDYSYLNRANLKVVGLRTNEDVPVDQPRQVSVEVHNTGTLTACQASVGLVDRRKGEPDVEVYGAGGLRPDVGACRKRPDGVLEGGLPPGEGRQFRFTWTPHGVGLHELVATADPTGVISELSEADNTVNDTLDVKLPSFPDVVARVSVSDDEPNIGDAVRVSLSLTNTGGIAAQSVNVTMKVGVTDLLGGFNEGLVPRIGPGETVWLNKTWRAVFPGKVLLYVNALPRDGVLERVETQGNNLVVQPLFVRSQGLDVTAKVVGIDAAPGEAKTIGFIISNNGDTPDAYDLVLDAPRGVRASIFLDGAKVDSISLANRTSRNLTAIVDLPGEFPAGDVELGLRAVSQNTTQTRVAQFTLSVKALYGFFLEAAQSEAKPGRVEIPLALTNLGNARDPFEVDVVNAPPGWTGVVANGVVDPYARATATLVIDVPTTTPRGIYEVLARVRDRAGTEATAVVGVTLLDYQAAVPTFAVERTVIRPASALPTTVSLLNEGNVRAETAVRVEAPVGWRAEVDRPTIVLDPGERADVALSLVVPSSAAFGTVGQVKMITTSGGVDRVAVLDVEVGESDLHVLELDYAPRVGIAPGAPVDFTAVVRNDGGLDARDVGVAFYVDDMLAGYETVGDLPAGGERTVSFRWSADAGEHVVLAILDPGDTVRETDEANNARLEVVRVARVVGILSAAREDVPGVGSFAVVALFAAVAAAFARKKR